MLNSMLLYAYMVSGLDICERMYLSNIAWKHKKPRQNRSDPYEWNGTQ